MRLIGRKETDAAQKAFALMQQESGRLEEMVDSLAASQEEAATLPSFLQCRLRFVLTPRLRRWHECGRPQGITR